MAGANWNTTSTINFRSAWQAIEDNKDVALRQEIVSDGRSDPDVLIQLLSSAVEQKHYPCVITLRDGGADPYAKPEYGRINALYPAILNDDVHCLRILTKDLEPGFNDETRRRELRKRPINESLMDAVSLGSLDCLKLLLSRGADVDVMIYHDDEFLSRCTPLMCACYMSPDTNQGDVTQYVSRKRKNTDEIVRILLDNGASVNIRNSSEKTALLFAAQSGLVTPMRMLLGRGADVNTRHLLDSTVLILATEANPPNIVEAAGVLIEAGADVNAIDRSRWTALHFATDNGNCDLVKLLLENGALPDHPDNERPPKVINNGAQSDTLVQDLPDSPLYSACCAGNVRLVKLLLRFGANVNAKLNRVGHSKCAFEHALQTGNSAIALLLLAAGFDRTEATRLMTALSSELNDTSRNRRGHANTGLILQSLRIIEKSFATLPSLRNICRLTIKKSMRSLRELSVLPLPQPIIDYLCLNDLDAE